MDVAIDLIYQLDYSYQLLFLACSLAALGLPLFLNRSKFWKSPYQQMKEVKIILEMQKLLLEINEKMTDSSGRLGSQSKDKRVDQQLYIETSFPLEAASHIAHEVSYYEKVRYALLGSLFFFLLMGIVALQRTESELMSGSDHISYLARELGLWAATAFGATLIPWGSKFFYFAYGFIIPILVSTIVVII